MPTLAGHWTKLQAVNQILDSIGEDPVNSLSSGLDDAELAERFLDDASRRIQLRGWHVNTRNHIELTLNTDDQFALPDNTLKVDTTNPRGRRFTSTPKPSAFVNAVMRRSGDDTKWLMYDLDNDTEVWTNSGVTTLTVDLVQLLDFANLTPALQMFIFTDAARRFQRSVMGSGALHQFTEQDVLDASVDAVNEDMENEDLNIIRDNAHVHGIVWRNNPRFGQ
jgi:hypothetical protein